MLSRCLEPWRWEMKETAYMREDRRFWQCGRIRWLSFIAETLLTVCLAVLLIVPLSAASSAMAVPWLPSNASCARLARTDPTATNGAYWGSTILPGFGASGGWFGVPVCANGANQMAPGGANISCDRVPTDFRATGCAPGGVTDDGYGWSFQCVELVIRFSAWAFDAPPSAWHGDAQYLWLSVNHPASFTPNDSGGAVAPVPGDILVWGGVDSHGRPWPASPAGGHVAVVAATGPDWITFVEENVLGRNGDIPEETTSLTQRDGHWSIGHTYAQTGGRVIYGWLHETGNSGHISGSRPASSAGSAPSAGARLPSLSRGVTVTSAGALAQLVWSDTHTAQRPISAPSAATPSALAESLGAPPGVSLSPDQTPVAIALPGDARYVFARGENGRLYAVYTPGAAISSPIAADILWQDLAAPTGLTVKSGAAALWDGRDIIVAAVASDNAVWARIGPPGALGAWVNLGKPDVTGSKGFQGAPALARAPGAQRAATQWITLALGLDGKLYEADGQANSGVTWETWAPLNTSAVIAPMAGAPLAFSESTSGATDAVIADENGALWLLRQTAVGQPWLAEHVALPDASATLMAATLGSAASGKPTLLVYVTDPHITAATAPASSASPANAILVSQVPLNATRQTTAVNWSLLGYLPSSADATSSAASLPVALDLGAGQRAILFAKGSEVSLTGDPAAINLLTPGAPSSPTADAQTTSEASAPAPVAGAGTVLLGPVAPASSFGDAFLGPSLDSRWVGSSGTLSAASVARGALTLTMATPSQSATITQGAPAGDFTTTVQVIPDPSWRASDSAQASLTLALDSWNSVTLSLRANGSVVFCPVAAGKAQACDIAAAPAIEQTGVRLRVTQSGDAIRGEANLTGSRWTLVGTWQIPWLASAGVPLGAYAPLAAPLGAANPGGYGAVPLAFTGLSLSVSGAASGPRGQAVAQPLGASAMFREFIVTTGAVAA
jgi:hypothetical protein